MACRGEASQPSAALVGHGHLSVFGQRSPSRVVSWGNLPFSKGRKDAVTQHRWSLFVTCNSLGLGGREGVTLADTGRSRATVGLLTCVPGRGHFYWSEKHTMWSPLLWLLLNRGTALCSGEQLPSQIRRRRGDTADCLSELPFSTQSTSPLCLRPARACHAVGALSPGPKVLAVPRASGRLQKHALCSGCPGDCHRPPLGGPPRQHLPLPPSSGPSSLSSLLGLSKQSPGAGNQSKQSSSPSFCQLPH